MPLSPPLLGLPLLALCLTLAPLPARAATGAPDLQDAEDGHPDLHPEAADTPDAQEPAGDTEGDLHALLLPEALEAVLLPEELDALLLAGQPRAPLPLLEEEGLPGEAPLLEEGAEDGAEDGEGFEALEYEPPEARSLRVRRSIVVREAPREDALPVGTLAQDMRVTWMRAAAGRGPECEAWVEVAPRGWVCARYLEANFRAPRLRELPQVPEGQLTPGVYASLVGGRAARLYPSLEAARRRRGGVRPQGSVTVTLVREERVGRRVFFRTSARQWVEARFVRRFTPSAFMGLSREALAGRTLPLGWALSTKRPRAPVAVRAGPSADAPRVGELPPRAEVPVLAVSPDRLWVQVAEGGWVERADVRVAWPTPPPDGLPQGSRWLDVDLAEQVLVAYEDGTPVHATLVSSGGPGHETPQGLFRIWLKLAETDMTGRMGSGAGADAYQVSTVPWTMFFQDDFALHTAYWHERFGVPGSHGCVNLAPRDAQALYRWSHPRVPTGWTMAYHSPAHPGSWVRVRRGGEGLPGALPGAAVAHADVP